MEPFVYFLPSTLSLRKLRQYLPPEPQYQVIHQLRINCKKLRYLMEFFTLLLPPAEIKKLIRSLKMLQDNPGNFNDYSVQQQFLEKTLANDIAGGVKVTWLLPNRLVP